MKLKLEEKEIVIALSREPKTFEQTQKRTGLSYTQTRENLKNLLSKGMIDRWAGFPTRYVLKKSYWHSALDWEKKLDMNSLKTLNCNIAKQKPKE